MYYLCCSTVIVFFTHIPWIFKIFTKLLSREADMWIMSEAANAWVAWFSIFVIGSLHSGISCTDLVLKEIFPKEEADISVV